ncbi:MAG TPA: prepilin-type N-terminal cleavage/methylation domain-containing protein [Acidimicrobiales bacterium]|jgi:general secretion pathway protein G
MFEKYKEIQQRKAAGELEESGFTLIELLIVIVVLGILAAVVVFALGSVTGQSAIAACNSDAKTVETAVAAYQANVGSYPASGATGQTALTSSATQGGPYLRSWPSNASHYAITLAGSGVVNVTPLNGTATNYDNQVPAVGTTQAATGCYAVS